MPPRATQAPVSGPGAPGVPTAPPGRSAGVETVTGASPAVRSAVTVQVGVDPFVPLVDPAWPCAQWLDLAYQIGWPAEELPTVGYVIDRESKCHPEVEGTLVCSGGRCARAEGLMQLLGWSCPPAGCLDAASNLAKGLELWRASGWRSWCLTGDPVTGPC
jgi:hypothetical protein